MRTNIYEYKFRLINTEKAIDILNYFGEGGWQVVYYKPMIESKEALVLLMRLKLN